MSSIVIGKGSWYQAALSQEGGKKNRKGEPFLTYTLTRPILLHLATLFIGNCDHYLEAVNNLKIIELGETLHEQDFRNISGNATG